MKAASFFLGGATFVANALAQDAYLWTIDAGTIKAALTQATTVSVNTASSIIARRRGESGDRYLGSVDDSTLQDIYKFGGYQTPLFAADKSKTSERILLRISGFNGVISEFASLPDIWIEEASRDLQDDFKARKGIQGICEYDLKVPTKEGVEIVYSYASEEQCLSSNEVRDLPTVLALLSTAPTAENVGKKINNLLKTLSHLAVTSEVESTILVLPSTSKLQKSKVATRRAPLEEPLDLPQQSTSESTRAKSIHVAANTSHPLPKIIPQCFKSQDACANTTNTCSGHGKCIKAHAGCYKCQCGTTVVRETENGKKTVQWGGNACQKKDISVPFILFASFGVIMAALVAGGIGMLYNMGAQELPSVLSAGVGSSRGK